VLIAIVAAALYLTYDLNRPPDGSLRQFDPVAVGQSETAMWRAYYDRDRPRLFLELLRLLREQYRLSPAQAVVTAFHAARAAVVFQSGRVRTDYEKALPDLEAYYQRILPISSDVRPVARFELQWWILHRERSEQLKPSLAQLQAAIYHLPPSRFEEHARLRAEAMRIRDQMKSDGTSSEAEWSRIRQLLIESWVRLHEAVN
jgi:hypothetical protein